MTFLLNLMFFRLGKFDGLYSGEWGEGRGIYMGGGLVFRMLIGLHISGRVVYSRGHINRLLQYSSFENTSYSQSS